METPLENMPDQSDSPPPTHPPSFPPAADSPTSLRQREARLQLHMDALSQLAQNPVIAQGNLQEALRHITETSARTLGVERTSIWFYTAERTSIICHDLYRLSHNNHSRGEELLVQDFPQYFRALELNRVITADDARVNPHTYEFADPYLEKFGIYAMLEAPIRHRQYVVGVICHEAIEPRHWHLEDQQFVGSVADFISLALESAERRQIEESLRESEEQYRLVAEYAGDGLLTFDTSGYITFTNSHMSSLTGYESHELLGEPVAKLLPNDNLAEFLALLRRLSSIKQNETPVRLGLVHHEGHTLTVEMALTQFQRQGDVFYLAVMRDVTEREQREQALRASEERYRRMVEVSPDGIAIIQHGRVCFVNHALSTILGAPTAESLLNQEWLSFIHPEDKSQERLRFQQLSQGQDILPTTSAKYLRRDGTAVTVEVSAATIEFQHAPAVQLYVRDVTERRQVEEALRQSQKMESLGVLAGGVAHDFNNLLVAMLGQTSLALRYITAENRAYTHIKKAMKAAKRASDLTRQLLAYSGRGQFENAIIDLNQLITENLHLFEVAIPKHITLTTELSADLPLIEADTGQMQQVFMNLLINASEAIGDAPGHIQVRTQTYLIDDEEHAYWNGFQALRHGRYIRVDVSDNGCGMDEATRNKIFDPFFSTKNSGHGLGLAAVMGILRGHNGGLTVTSTAEVGTTFSFLIPEATTQTA
ncbi:MAG: PAS domain S-box protein, partial [Anaerolineales bacterium]|nr:PAS domain S-box protein [Anaerolineales bacterium]